MLKNDRDPVPPSVETESFPRSEHHRYVDTGELAESIPGHEQFYYQLSPGAFEGSLQKHVISERAAFFIERSNRSIRKKLHVLPGHLRIAFLASDKHHCCCEGETILGHNVTVTFPLTPVDLHFDEGAQEKGGWITLDLSAVARIARLGDKVGRLEKPGGSLVPDWAAPMLRNMLSVAQTELFSPGFPPSTSRAAAFERALFSVAAWFLAAAFDAESEPDRIPVWRRSRLLRKACEVIDAKLGDELTMSELSSIVGVSRRTLESIFLEGIGVSPYQYVRTIRLNVIRRELLSEDKILIPIGDIAATYGVWHLSRFAADYKRMFGDLPSEERRRVLPLSERVRTTSLRLRG